MCEFPSGTRIFPLSASWLLVSWPTGGTCPLFSPRKSWKIGKGAAGMAD